LIKFYELIFKLHKTTVIITNAPNAMEAMKVNLFMIRLSKYTTLQVLLQTA